MRCWKPSKAAFTLRWRSNRLTPSNFGDTTMTSLSCTTVTLSFSYLGTSQGNDYLTVFDGSGTAGAQLGRLSGTALPAPITSSGQFMTLQFTSYCCSARLGGFYASIAPGGSTLQTCAGQQAVAVQLAGAGVAVGQRWGAACVHGHGHDAVHVVHVGVVGSGHGLQCSVPELHIPGHECFLHGHSLRGCVSLRRFFGFHDHNSSNSQPKLRKVRRAR